LEIFGSIYIQGDSCNILTENILIPGCNVLTQKFKTMVTIINYKERQKEDGTSFYVLEFQGGIEMIKNKKTFHIFAIVQSKREALILQYFLICCTYVVLMK